MPSLIAPLRRFLRLDLGLTPYLSMKVTPPTHVMTARPEDVTGPIPDFVGPVHFTAVVAQKRGSINIVPPDLFSALTHANFEVWRMRDSAIMGVTTLIPVLESGDSQPAQFDWTPTSAGNYRVFARSQRTTDALEAQMDYQIPIRVKLDAVSKPGGVTLTAHAGFLIPPSELSGLRLNYAFAALRTDIPDQQAVWRSWGDPEAPSATVDINLERGTYNLLCDVFQFSDEAGIVAGGDAAIAGFIVG